MSPPFSTPVPDEFVPRDVPAPSRISTTFLSPRYRAIVKSKQTPFSATSLSSPAVSDSRRDRDDRHFRLDYRASPFTLTFIPYDLLPPSPLLPYYLKSLAIFIVFHQVVSFFYFFSSNKIEFRDLYAICRMSRTLFFYTSIYILHVFLCLCKSESKNMNDIIS